MLRAHLERSLDKHLKANLPDSLVVDSPGTSFRASGLDRWFRWRIVAIDPDENSHNGEEDDLLLLEFECHIPTDQKGGRSFDLSELVDELRAVVDSTLSAPAAQVRNSAGAVAGVIMFGPAAERRAYGQSVTTRNGESIPGVDSATLSVPCRVAGGSCG